MEKEKIEENKELFITLLRGTGRKGIDNVIDGIEKLGFFKAPASAKHHLAEEGGLLQHSLNVYTQAVMISGDQKSLHPHISDKIPVESIAITALLHDVCKVGVYKTSFRNKKNEAGVWEQVPFYEFEDTLPYGHGEKSVYIISGFMRLTREEAFAIRYHMGFSNGEDPRQVGNALTRFPLAFALATADMEATYFLESGNEQ